MTAEGRGERTQKTEEERKERRPGANLFMPFLTNSKGAKEKLSQDYYLLL